MKALLTQFDDHLLEKTVATPTCSSCCCCCCCVATTIVSSVLVAKHINNNSALKGSSKSKRHLLSVVAFLAVFTGLPVLAYFMLESFLSNLDILIIFILVLTIFGVLLRWRGRKDIITKVSVTLCISIFFFSLEFMIGGAMLVGILEPYTGDPIIPFLIYSFVAAFIAAVILYSIDKVKRDQTLIPDQEDDQK